MPEKAALSLVTQGLVKSRGRHILGSGDVIRKEDRTISTGSILLDICLGGGFVVGRVHAFWGDKSSGKSTTAQRGAGIFQGLCRNCWRPAKNVVAVPPTQAELSIDPATRWTAIGECDCFRKGVCDLDIEPPPKNKGEGAADYRERVVQWHKDITANSYEETVVAWIDAEDAFDKAYFSLFGDPKRLMYMLPINGQEAMDFADALASTACVDLMVIDSLANLVPREELDGSMDDWQQALQARITNKGIRRLISKSALNQREGRRLTQIWINQVREALKVKYGDPSVKPGGKGQDFNAHIEIRFRTPGHELLNEKWGDEKKGEVTIQLISETFNFETVKCRAASQRRVKGKYIQSSIETDTYPMGAILDLSIINKMVAKFLMVENKGKGEKYKLGNRGFKTQAAIFQAIEDEPEVLEMVREALIARCVRKATPSA